MKQLFYIILFVLLSSCANKHSNQRWFPSKQGCYNENLLSSLYLLDEKEQIAPSLTLGYWADRKQLVYAYFSQNSENRNEVSITFAKQLITPEGNDPVCVTILSNYSCPKINETLKQFKNLSIPTKLNFEKSEEDSRAFIMHGTSYFLEVNEDYSHRINWRDYASNNEVNSFIKSASDLLEECVNDAEK